MTLYHLFVSEAKYLSDTFKIVAQDNARKKRTRRQKVSITRHPVSTYSRPKRVSLLTIFLCSMTGLKIAHSVEISICYYTKLTLTDTQKNTEAGARVIG